MLYDDFQPVVDLVLNNWTALQLAVEHGMGAPGGEKTAQLMSVYIARYCVENIVDQDELTEVLEDLMDEEFDTVCHDGSPKEIAAVLLLYLRLLKDGQHDELRARIEAMPKCQKWLSQPIHESVPPQCHGNPDDDTTSSSEEDDNDQTNNDVTNGVHQNGVHQNGVHQSGVHQSGVHQNGDTSQASSSQPEPMDEDEVEPGWTVVRTRRRK